MKYGMVAIKAGIVVVAIISLLFLFVLISDKPEQSPVAWSLGADDPVLKIFPSADPFFVVSSANVSMVNSSGYTLWSHPIGDTRFSTLCPDGSLLAYSGDKGLVRLYDNGSFFAIDVPQIMEAAATAANGNAYIRVWDRLSLVRPDGKEVWNVSKVAFGPAVDGDGIYAVFIDAAKGGSLSFIDENGTIRWDLRLNSHDIKGLVADGSSGVYVYDDGKVSRVSPSGNLLWSYTPPGGGQLRYVLSDDHRHGILSHGTVSVLDMDGVTVSRFNHNLSMAGTDSPVALEGDTIYIAGPGGSEDTFVLYALRPDGSVRWSRLMGGSAPVNVYARNGTICAATELMDGHRLRPVLYIMNESGTGDIRYFSEDGRPWAQISVVPGHVYARTYGGRLYAFDA